MLPKEPLLAHFTLDENPTRALVFRVAITILVLIVAARIAG
jgi:hypothetical protein